MTIMKTSSFAVLATAGLALAGCALHLAARAAAPYAVGATYALPGSGRWDLLAVDPDRHHLLLSRSDRVQVMDTRDGRLVGEIAGTDGVHGIAIAPRLRRGYASNGHANTVTEFDLATLQRIRDVPVIGRSPDAVLFEALSGRLFFFNGASANASVLDPAAGKEIATIPLDGKPELAASDGRGHVFVNIEDKAKLVELDAATMRVTNTWLLSGCEEPSGLAIDVVHARLFSVCRNQMMVVTDAGNGRQVARVPIGDGPDGAAFDPLTQTAFSPNGKAGTLTIVHEDDPEHFRVVQTLATQRSARTIALDAVTHRLYLPAATFEPQRASEPRPPMLPDSFRVLVVSRGEPSSR